jgi:hypothetical protein
MSKEWKGLPAKMLAWMLMLTASLLNFLNFHEYPLFRPEVAIVLLGFAVFAAAMGGLERGAPRLAFVFTAMLIALGADLNLDGSIWPLVIGLLALALAWRNNTAAVKIASAAFATVIMFQTATGVLAAWPSASATEKTASAPAEASRPPIVHLLLDSYLGLEGMAADPAYDELRTETADFYQRHGFRVYEGAYSRHANTANSVPYFLSFGTADLAKVSQVDDRLKPDRLDYFDRLSSQGYDISVRGANYLDLCTEQSVEDCRQFSYSGLDALTKFRWTAVDRAETLAISLAGMSSLPRNLYDDWVAFARATGLPHPMVMRNLVKTSTPKAALTVMELRRELARPQYGKVYFAHLLLPHEPYVFDANCTIKPRSAWHTEMDGAAQQVRAADYRSQTRCMHRLLGPLFDSLQQSPAGRDAIVIVQGDHGSRIVTARPISEEPNASVRDYAMSYSAMFAVRAPGIDPGLAKGRASLDELLKDFAESDFAAAPPAGVRPAEVILATWDWIPRQRTPLPEYGSD